MTPLQYIGNLAIGMAIGAGYLMLSADSVPPPPSGVERNAEDLVSRWDDPTANPTITL